MSYPGAIAPPAGEQADLNNPQDVLRTINYVTQVLTLVFVTLFVALRLFVKFHVYKGRWTADDYIDARILHIRNLRIHGGGLNQWEVERSDVESFLKCGYAATIFYAPMAMFVKIALLALIARIFGEAHRKTLIGIYVLLGLVVSYYVSGLIVKICICNPISAYWKGDMDKCLNQSAIITTDAAVSVISDLAILCIPIPLTWSLQLSKKKKLRVIGILCAGGMATAFSIYRLGMIVAEGKSTNQTIVFTKVVLTGNAEVGIGLICACLPSVTALILRRHRINSEDYYGYPQNDGSIANGIVVNRSFHLSAESRSNQKRVADSNAFELMPDQAELMSNAQAIHTKDSSRRSLSI
ncbi:hypothetical protein MGN70_009006 [Eutypa lata]|nr:hypothetical protein MGN70_009006 [Eutypa lata]